LIQTFFKARDKAFVLTLLFGGKLEGDDFLIDALIDLDDITLVGKNVQDKDFMRSIPNQVPTLNVELYFLDKIEILSLVLLFLIR
jgi:hypothetical protein